MDKQHQIAQRYGPMGLLSFDRAYRQLTEQGWSKRAATQQAEQGLLTCSKCQRPVSDKSSKRKNQRQRSDGGMDHIDCGT